LNKKKLAKSVVGIALIVSVAILIVNCPLCQGHFELV